MSARMVFRASLFLTAAGLLAAQPSKEVHRLLPLAADGVVAIETHKGSIRMEAWDREEVQLDVRIVEDGGWMAQDLRRAEVDIEATATDVRLKSDWDVPGSLFGLAGSSPNFHYFLRVPRNARVRITDHKSDIGVEGLAGDLDLNTHKGTVRLRALEGGLTVNTHKGDVRVEFTRFDTRSSIETHKGEIDVVMPRDARFNLRQALDKKADLRSDFPVILRASRGGTYSTSAVNGGGAELSLRSHKGSFRVRQR